VGAHAAVARPVGYRVAATEVPEAIERLLRAFLAERRPGENFRQFCAAHTDEEIRHMLAGETTVAAERDVALARPPHGVDG
jgi:sulfite reductase (ferredoxin)